MQDVILLLRSDWYFKTIAVLMQLLQVKILISHRLKRILVFIKR